MTETDEILLSVQPQGALGLITLNRPKALNALTWPMIRAIDAALTEWEVDPAIRAVALTGAGGRAFCAGGDVKAAWQAGMAVRRGEPGAQSPNDFFRDEYRLNRRLFHYPKPLIALMDGIVMGGGYGLAGQCRIRVASPRAAFAMPETGIGFFPDVGSAWHLARMPDFSGFYLGVTGATVGVDDMIHIGVATHIVPLEDWLGLPERMDQALAQEEPAEAVLPLSAIVAGGGIAMNRPLIAEAFSRETVEDILACLDAHDGAFASETAALMRRRSPTSLHVALRHLRMAAGEDFDRVIGRDYRLAQRFMRDSDFYEGVRAALIDRDGRPEWRPFSPAEVGEIFAADGASLNDIGA